MINSLPEILQRRDREHDANARVIALIYIKSALTALNGGRTAAPSPLLTRDERMPFGFRYCLRFAMSAFDW
jgi:hypothetical protein